MTAGFVAWGQRTFMEFLLQSPNAGLRERLLPGLIAGRVAGASGLSNALKFLCGLEEWQITGAAGADGFIINGKLPWVTNLCPGNFHVAAAVARSDRPDEVFCVALPHDAPGLTRSDDLDLMAMRGSRTAAVRLTETSIGLEQILHDDARTWLPQVRPAVLGLQCGMSIGLARRALSEASHHQGYASTALQDTIRVIGRELGRQEQRLREGLRTGRFRARAAPLFRIRIRLAELVQSAVSLELQASGGRAYLAGSGQGFARRWREAALVPVVTPSLVQLKMALAQTGIACQTSVCDGDTGSPLKRAVRRWISPWRSASV
jgi:hypothetical protein